MAALLTVSMASLAVSGGRAVVARAGVAARAPASKVGGSAFFGRSNNQMTMSSSLAGVVMPRAVAFRKPVAGGGRGALVVVAGGNSLGCTLHGTRRARARTSGFRARLETPTGRALLKRRRAKGRKFLAPAGAVNGWNREKKKSLK